MSIRTEVYGTRQGPRIGVYLKDRATELTPYEAEQLIADLMERVDECEREERANAKSRIQRMWNAYEERKASHG